MAYRPVSAQDQLLAAARNIKPTAPISEELWRDYRLPQILEQQQGGGGGLAAWLRAKMADETGSSSLFVPPSFGGGPVSLGNLEQIRAAELAQGARGAARSQASKLIQARLRQNLGQIPELDLPRIPGYPEGIPSPASARAQLFPQALESGPAPAQPLALEAGAPLSSATGIDAAAPLRAAGAARNPALWDQMLGDAAAMSGGARQAPAAAAAAAEGAAPEAALNPGFISDIKNLKGNVGGMLTKLRAAGQAAAEASPGVAGTALEGLAAHPALTTLGGIGATVAAAPVGHAVTDATGSNIAGGAAEGALRWGGTAAALPGVGAVAAPIAAIVGGGYGAVSGPLKDYYAVNHYEDYANKFVKLAHAYHSDDQDKVRHQFGQAAMEIHNGPGSITDKALKLQQLVAFMGDYKKNGYSATPQAQQPAQTPDQKSDARLAIQMGQSMGQLSQDFVNQQKGAADMQRQAAAANPTLAPVLNADAASRESFGNTMADAFKGAAMMDPQISQMNNQIAYQQQLLASIRATQANAAAAGGGSNQLSGLLNNTGQTAQAQGAAQAQNAAAAQLQANQYAAQLLGQ